MKQPEILAPAGSMEALIAAVRCGADAVYVGGMAYSARSSAANFDLEQLAEGARLCHLYGAKLYLAVNTLLTDREFPAFLEFVRDAAACGVDACIVQDLGVLESIRRMLPDMPLHASTQMSIHSPQGARQAAALGCTRVVAAREMSAQDLKMLCALPIEVEVFVHGALCMSVSGQCAFSALIGGRSANRGRCAQACRLPWKTPKGANPAALSLKDLSLVSHVAKLREIGVTSFKIEGRMKRPEYVAAAVTALRMALDGQQPDMETLQAVFARSGFTDGYFTGSRRDMFGYRRKEDVVAAQKVLQTLQNTYQKPRKAAEISFSMQLRTQHPAILKASDQEGNTVTIKGEIPQPALKRPLDQPTLQKHLQKLGDTIFYGGETSLDNPEDLTLSAAQCNAMRREAVDALYALRTRQNHPEYPVSAPWQLPETVRRNGAEAPVLRLHVHDTAQLACALGRNAITCVPVRFAEQCAPSMSIWLEAPRIIADEAEYVQRLARLKTAGFQHLLCHNIADIRIGMELGFTLHGGYGLNCTNRRTALSLQEQGLEDVTGSYELRLSQLTALGTDMLCGGYVYGRLPMMLLRLCPIKAQDGCRRQNCFMTDRTGQQFPLLCSGDYTELCNAKTLWLADKCRQLQTLDYWDLYFTTESPTAMQKVIDAYEGEWNAVPEDRTNGMYFKGGMA